MLELSKKIILLIAILLAVTSSVAFIAVYFLYDTSQKNLKSYLYNLVENEREHIEFMVSSGVSKDSIIAIIAETERRRERLGSTSETIIVELNGEYTNFIYNQKFF